MALAFKITEQVEQRICIKFCVKFKHSSPGTIQMIQKATAMGNRWLAASSWQHACSCITSRAEFFQRHRITQVTEPLYCPDMAPGNFWLFPKLKSPLKGKRFQTIDEIQENTTEQLMVTGKTVRSQGTYFEGDWSVIVLCTMFLVSYLFFSKCLYFSYYMAGYLLDRPSIYGTGIRFGYKATLE